MDALRTETVGAIVARDYRAAEVFERHDVDFCCGGDAMLEDACRAAGADPDRVIAELKELSAEPAPATELWETRQLDELTRHIVQTHHAYINAAIPVISGHLHTVARAHGTRHPEVIEAARWFDRLAEELVLHMRNEELVLFPHIEQMVDAHRSARPSSCAVLGSLTSSVDSMRDEHDSAGEAIRLIRRLTNNFEPPHDACATYRAALSELAAFEADLHRHIHLENNILLPRAAELERPGRAPM